MEDETIWRYMDFTKFVDLLATESLFFCRSDKFNDPFEGSVPTKHYERRLEEIKNEFDDFEHEKKMFEKIGQEYKKYVFVNCWHRNINESAALWKLYLKSNEGIAINSTRHWLSGSLVDSSHPVWNVPVLYIDYDNDDPPVPTSMAPFRYKRKSFEHEKELRAIIYADIYNSKGEKLEPLSNSGIRVKTNINDLIKSVVVAPTSPDWFFELVENVRDKYSFSFPVTHSEITIEKPKFI